VTIALRLAGPGAFAVVRAASLALVALTGFASGAAAQDAAATIEYRQNAMRMVAGHQNAIEALLEEGVAPDSHIDRERVREGLGTLSAGYGTCHQPFRRPAPGGPPPG
jgi:uncharacterized protein (DUF1778 family)